MFVVCFRNCVIIVHIHSFYLYIHFSSKQETNKYLHLIKRIVYMSIYVNMVCKKNKNSFVKYLFDVLWHNIPYKMFAFIIVLYCICVLFTHIAKLVGIGRQFDRNRLRLQVEVQSFLATAIIQRPLVNIVAIIIATYLRFTTCYSGTVIRNPSLTVHVRVPTPCNRRRPPAG